MVSMKKSVTLTLLLTSLLSLAGCIFQGRQAPAAALQQEMVIGFYNMENLFDTVHDPGKEDQDFLPGGEYDWTQEKYEKKLGNMAHVIATMARENGRYHAVLGVAEVENARVLKDLVARPEIAEAGYRFVHFESPDDRGIDVALLYRKDLVRVVESKALKLDKRRTRSTLLVRAEIDGEAFAFFVAHLPSRRNEENAQYRRRGAEIIYKEAMRLQDKYPGIKIVVMGDMNDNPPDPCMSVDLRGRKDPADVDRKSFFAPLWSLYDSGYGSESYRSEWNLFDCILVNDALVHAPEGSYAIQRIGDFWGEIYDPPFLTQQDGRYKGTPFRTFSRNEFTGGYSDHYPTFIRLGK